MANRTVKDAVCIKGTNPQYLIEKIIRTRIYESKYWKEECFALSAELLVDKAMELKFFGGVYGGNVKVSPFLCLILKMLQIQPEKDIVVEFIKQPDFKYVRALGAMYMRLIGTNADCYNYLEPLYLDYRKMKRINREGKYDLLPMDVYIDELLREERVFDIILPRLQKRSVLEQANELEPKIHPLMDDGDMDMSDEEVELKESTNEKNSSTKNHTSDSKINRRSRSPAFESSRHRRSRTRSPVKRKKSASRSRSREKERDRERDRDRERERERDRERDKDKDRSHRDRHRSRSKERRNKRDRGNKDDHYRSRRH